MSETSFRLIVAASAVALGALLLRVRFAGVPPLPPRPPMPPETPQTAQVLLETTLASPAVWRNFLQTDARAAGVPATTPDEMAKVLPYQVEASPHVLTFAAPTLQLAGLELTLERGERDSTVLVLKNVGRSPVAYRVLTRATESPSACNVASPLAINALVINAGQSMRRSECAARSNRELTVLSVETIELTPLAAWYVQHVSPLAVGLEPRWARAHRPVLESNCSSIVPGAVRQAVQKGDLTWRDLVDFFARHRCETYQFPITYKAFTKDGELELPVLPPGESAPRN